MEKSTRNILILIGVAAIGVTAYCLLKKESKTINVGVTAESKKDTIKFVR